MNKSKTLYLNCISGISGDMFVASMLDLGADEAVLMEALASLPLSGFRAEIARVQKSSIDCCDFNVILDADNHDHDMAYLHGDAHGHHTHEHTNEHAHRGLREIEEILDAGEMTEGARSLAKKIFRILAEAEAKAHARAVEGVHFHEVGAVDSIVDIAAAAICFDNLQIERVYCSPIYEGSGTVRSAHGILPVPVPAVVNIAAANPLVRISPHDEMQGEFITPTGAAIVSAVVTERGIPEDFSIAAVGLGAGKRSYERPSFLRAMLIEEAAASGDVVWKLETDIDDCGGETLAYLMEELLAMGARDAHYLPIVMKKSRPAWQLQVLCDEEDIDEIEARIFAETTTIGIRRQRCERTVLAREIRQVDTPYGRADVKCVQLGDSVRAYPEYESVCALARDTGLPFREIYEAVKNATQP